MKQYYNDDMNDVFKIVSKTLKEEIDVLDITKKQNASLFFRSNFKVFLVTCSFKFYLIVPIVTDIDNNMLANVTLSFKHNDNYRVILYLFNPSLSNKTFFNEKQISYISSDGDKMIFYNNKLVNIYNPDEKLFRLSYTKKTQLLAEFYLMNPIKKYSSFEIARRINMSKSTVSRGNSFLLEIEAVNKVGMNTGARFFIKSKKDFLNKIKPYLLNPVRRRFYKLLAEDEMRWNSFPNLYCGESAFSKYTDLENNIEQIEIAYSKENYSEVKTLSDSWLSLKPKTKLFCFYEFIYDPFYFESGQYISIFDTYIMMSKKYRKSKEFRIQHALKTLEDTLINE